MVKSGSIEVHLENIWRFQFRYDQVTSILNKLQWLPFTSRIKNNILFFTFNSFITLLLPTFPVSIYLLLFNIFWDPLIIASSVFLKQYIASLNSENFQWLSWISGTFCLLISVFWFPWLPSSTSWNFTFYRNPFLNPLNSSAFPLLISNLSCIPGAARWCLG